MRSLAIAALAAALLPIPSPTTPADAGNEPPRVGVFFWHDSPNDVATLSGLRLGLERSGFVCELIERHADSDEPLARRQLLELDQECAVVVTLGTQATLLAKDVVRRAPIVFAAVTNPVASGIVADFGPSGTALCGATNWIDPANVLEVFRLAVPELRTLGMLRSRRDGVVSAAELAAMRAHLATPDAPPITVVEAVAADADDLERALDELLAANVDALWIPIDLTVYRNVARLAALPRAAHLPLLTTALAGVENGAVVGAAVDYRLHGQRAAARLLEVLRDGRAPGSLPVDRMRSRQVVVNLAAARRRQLDLPLSLLVLADELIEPTPATPEPVDGPR